MKLEEQIEQSNRQETAQFKAGVIRYLKKWPWVAICVILALIITHFRLKFVANKYKVESTIEITKSEQLDNPNEILFGSKFRRKLSDASDEAIIFKSFPLVKDALKALKFEVVYTVDNGYLNKELYENRPFIFEYDRLNDTLSLPTGVKFNIQLIDDSKFQISTDSELFDLQLNQTSNFSEPIKLGDFTFSIQKSKKFNQLASYEQTYSVKILNIESITYAYRNKLKVEERETFSKILKMSMVTANPQKTIDFMNTLIDKYIDQNLVHKNEAARKTLAFIDKQLASISDSLSKREKNLETFKSSEKMSDLSVEGKLLIEKYNTIESKKAQYEVVQRYYDYLQSNIKKGGESNLNSLIAPSAFGIQDLIINDLVKTLLELNMAEKNLIQAGNTKSPMLSQIKSRKKEVISALEVSIENLSKANKIILDDLNKQAEEASISARKLPNTERQLVNLNRLLKLNENIYLFLMQKRSSAAISMSSNTPDCKVIEPAMLNSLSPISPKKRMVYLIAIILGIIIPSVVIVGVDFLNDTINSKGDIEAGTNTPIMGLIPKGKADGTQFVAIEKPKSVLAESFRIIRTNLSFFQKNKHPFVIMLTSTIAKEGKTFCAINLASILAASGKKTVLLGFDLRKPKIHNYLSMENSQGISNYLTERAELKDILTPTKQDGLFLINSGNIPPNPAELIIGKRTGELIAELKASFDYIILDTPPLGIVADALILKEHSDLNLYVVRQGYSKRDFLSRINELVEGGNMEHLSILVNDADKATKYGSGYYELEKDRSFISRFFGSRKA